MTPTRYLNEHYGQWELSRKDGQWWAVWGDASLRRRTRQAAIRDLACVLGWADPLASCPLPERLEDWTKDADGSEAVSVVADSIRWIVEPLPAIHTKYSKRRYKVSFGWSTISIGLGSLRDGIRAARRAWAVMEKTT